MKTTQPLRRHLSLVSFSKDHHTGLLLTWKIRQGIANKIEPERMSNYVQYSFDEDLGHHFKEEEERMFCKLPAKDPLRLQAENDHELITGLVEKLKASPCDQNLLVEFSNALEAHIRFEERVLFNHLQDTLAEEDLAMIATYEGTPAGKIDASWPDLFWLNVKAGTATKK